MFAPPGKRRVPNPFRDETDSLPICTPPSTSSPSSRFTLKTLFICVLLGLGTLSLISSKAGVENVVRDTDKHVNDKVGEEAITKDDDYLSSIPDKVETLRPVITTNDDTYQLEIPLTTPKPIQIEPVFTPQPTPEPINKKEEDINPHGHHGHHNHALGTSLLSTFTLWLDSSEFTTIHEDKSSKTFSWDDQNMGSKKFEFLSLSPSESIFSKSKLNVGMNEFKNSYDSVQDSLKLPVVTVSPYVPSLSSNGVTFPGPLRSPNFKLQYVSTLFFVLKPDIIVKSKSNIAGTEFFGYGGLTFSIDKGMIAFTGNNNNKERIVTHMTQSYGHVNAGEIICVVFKLNGDRKMSSFNGSPFEMVKVEHVFGSEEAVLGGGGSGRSFVGSVMEVIVINEMDLDEEESGEVVNYLAKKWDIEGIPDDVNLKTDPRLTPNGNPGEESETVEAVNHAEHKNPKPDELTDVEKEELKKKEQEAKQAADKVKKADWLADLDRLHEKAVAEAKEATEKHVNDVKNNAPKTDQNIDDMWTVSKAQNFIPGPCKASGDSFKGAPLKVWSLDKSNNYIQVMWPPPSTAEFKDINTYTTAYDDAMKSISRVKKGGEELKKFVHKEITGLKELRHGLFCKENEGEGGLRS